MADWPKFLPRVRVDKAGLQATFHQEFGEDRCWLCRKRPDWGDKHELHHLAAGSRGRSHERELFTMLCKTCHKSISPDDLPRLLKAKWAFDHDHCDWEWLTLRHGFHLPDWPDEVVNGY